MRDKHLNNIKKKKKDTSTNRYNLVILAKPVQWKLTHLKSKAIASNEQTNNGYPSSVLSNHHHYCKLKMFSMETISTEETIVIF